MPDYAELASPVSPLTRNGQLATYGTDAALLITFFKKKVPLVFESEGQGKPISEFRDYIRIVMHGGKSTVEREVLKQVPPELADRLLPDTERWPRQWQAFVNQQEQVQGGTALEDWPPMPRELVEDFKATRVFTVESLAALADSNATNMPLEWRKYRDKAIHWLQNAAGGSALAAVEAKNANLERELDAMRKQIEMLAHPQEPPKRGPGRPPKIQVTSQESA